MRAKSRTLLIRRVRRAVSAVMMLRYDRCLAGSETRPSASNSENIRIEVSGVLSSCETLLTKSRSEERRVGKECRTRWSPGQAEDGIRDLTVTGVQTCALPIYAGKIEDVINQAGEARGFGGDDAEI